MVDVSLEAAGSGLRQVASGGSPDSVKAAFAAVSEDLVVDRNFIKKLRNYTVSFANKNSDHIAFLGGNLLGVHPIRFHPEDRDAWFDDVLDIDEVQFKGYIKGLDSINPQFKISSDAFNLSCVALLNRIYESTKINPKEKEDALTDCVIALQYKFISSLMYHYFPYPADKGVAQATYAALSKKFTLKVHGSWQALLENRTKSILAHNSIHYTTYTKMDSDSGVVYMLNDVQGRLREIVKSMRDVFETILTSKSKIVTTSTTSINIDGESFVRDKTRNFNSYKRYLHETVSDSSNFIKSELTGIITSAMKTMPERFLTDTLMFMSKHYRSPRYAHIEELVDETLLHAFDYISSNRAILANPNDLAGMLTRLRAVYMSSRSSDASLLKMRKLSEEIVEKAIKSRNVSIIASVRTGLMLYLVLRAFTMKHYT
tara:strand:+ start:113 stop:1399 length:1287 start_codon:yes stop_codon:yes gene_type:complete